MEYSDNQLSTHTKRLSEGGGVDTTPETCLSRPCGAAQHYAPKRSERALALRMGIAAPRTAGRGHRGLQGDVSVWQVGLLVLQCHQQINIQHGSGYKQSSCATEIVEIHEIL